jgi:hemolysin III
VLAIVWSGAAAAIILKFAWVGAPKWLSAVTGVAVGWAGVAAMPQVDRHDGIAPVVLLAAGGLAYTAGALVYATRKPDPSPRVFGFHEVFHACTLVGALLHLACVASIVRSS